jgi:hypothetical protein
MAKIEYSIEVPYAVKHKRSRTSHKALKLEIDKTNRKTGGDWKRFYL